MAFSNGVITLKPNETDYLREGYLYTEYDFGSFWANDDAWLKAENYGGGSRYSYTEAVHAGRFQQHWGDDANNYYSKVEFPGVDFFDGAYSHVKGDGGDFEIIVKK